MLKRLIYLIGHPVEGFYAGVNILKTVFRQFEYLVHIFKERDSYTLSYMLCNVPVINRLLKGFFVNRVLIWYRREERNRINFADYITEVLLNQFGYKTVNYCNACLLNILPNYDFCMLVVGSELDKQMVDGMNIGLCVWGQGKDHGEYFDVKTEPYVNKVRIFAVRGPNTSRQLKLIDEMPIGDPAFLMPLFFKVKKDLSQFKVTYVHYWPERKEQGRKLEKIGAERYVNIFCKRSEFQAKLKAIVSSKFVLTDSLHTAIISHAYKVPWALCLPEGDELDYPEKWKDLFELLGIKSRGNIVKTYAEGLRWWEDIGPKTEAIDLWPLLSSFPLPIINKDALNTINKIEGKPDTSKLTCAFIIRFHYEENDPRFEWRLKLFKSEVLPRIQAQTDKRFDICVRCNPVHDEIFRNLGCKPFHVKNDYNDYILSEDGRARLHYDFVKWEDCDDIEQYDIQIGLDSDDLIAPDYVEKIKFECARSKTSLHISFQFDEYVLKTKKIRRSMERSTEGSTFRILYYPDKSVYHHCYETSHRTLYKLAARSIRMPRGYSWMAIHDQNESTGRVFADEELKGLKTWDERPWEH